MDAKIDSKGISDILQCPSSHQASGFTVMELLVVCGIMGLLATTVMPAAQSAARKARAIACQGQLRQWGMGLSMFLSEQDAPIIDLDAHVWDSFWRPYCDGHKGMFLCPMAKRYETNLQDPLREDREAIGCGVGSKFTAWRLSTRTPATLEPGLLFGSYGFNGMGLTFLDVRISRGHRFVQSNVPVFVDCVDLDVQVNTDDQPPTCEGELTFRDDIKRMCIDRHHGRVNSVFLDGSVRKIGLKELWTLSWSPWFDSRNAWTRAGGVQPQDWPRWMQSFEEY